MASIGVLGSLISQLGSTAMPQYNPQEVALTQQRIQGGRVTNETALLQLAEIKRAQEAEAEYLRAIQTDPVLRQQVFGGGSTLGALGQPSPGAGGGPMTQQAFGPGGTGPAQVVPGGQDLSQFATQGTPQSTLGALGPQPQGPPQAPQHPLLAMAQRNPQAAFLVHKQLLGQEDLQVKRQEQRLQVGTKVMEYLGRGAQGVTDQASLDAFRQEVARVHPQAAAQLPQTYSKEAMAPFIAKALDVKDAFTLQVQDLQAQADLLKARMSGRVASTDQYLKALGVRPGEETPEDMQRALALQTQHQAQIQAGNVSPQIIQGEGGAYWAVNPRTLEKRPVPGAGPPPAGGGGAAGSAPPGSQLRAPMSAEDKKQAGYINRAQEGNTQLEALESSGDYTAWTAPAQHLPGGRLLLRDKQKQYETAKGIFLQGILRRDSQGQITAQEWADYGRIYFPQPGDTADDVRQKRLLRDQYLASERTTLGRPSGQAAPSPGGASQAPLKPVGEMSREELLAERDRLRKGGS